MSSCYCIMMSAIIDCFVITLWLFRMAFQSSYSIRGAKQGGGGLGGSQPPLNFGGGGVERLSTPPDFEKKIFRGGWLPLN